MDEKKVSRREIIKMSLLTGTGIAIGASGLGSIATMTEAFGDTAEQPKKKDNTIPFYGKHQAGIITPQQTYTYVAAFDLQTDRKQEVIDLFKQWTQLSAVMSAGQVEHAYENDWLPPKDTGEALGLTAAKLTVTFGLGSSFFEKDDVDRYGILKKKPRHLKPIPAMPRDGLEDPYIGGDVCVQVCAEDQQVAFHAIRNMIKTGIGKAEVKWLQSGFISAPKGETPRNLFGFKDGSANVPATNQDALNQIVWVDDDKQNWMNGGSYLAFRRIQMFLEVWDRSSLKDQEDTFGRKKLSGAAYGKSEEHAHVNEEKLPPNSHVRLAKSTGQEIYRRAYSYTDGVNPRTGAIDAGLAFISYQKNPDKQFVPMLKKMSLRDNLNEYTKHVGSALFACPKGVQKGEYIAQGLLED
ncbi:deferrochelatase/peroxidase EfeB [Virgibacillus phasianinus]|uniref:Deferrochelatase n=1 Tax=Virgibacillus phasianinus TaxID=2017483 RepID=A0A220U4M9_9BACI|nr:iron uptake transporter deferrochelatase/peroxidase subunit [Virgibacillus phasianinus]ASK62683.1 deferrochelatase/peroxidase EfeB [Virgibacillus phasianinus]